MLKGTTRYNKKIFILRGILIQLVVKSIVYELPQRSGQFLFRCEFLIPKPWSRICYFEM